MKMLLEKRFTYLHARRGYQRLEPTVSLRMTDTLAALAEAPMQMEDAWIPGCPGPILNPRAHALQPLEVLNQYRHQH